MASNVMDTAADLGRKLVNRAETVVGGDWREAKKRANNVVREFRGDYRRMTGSNSQPSGTSAAKRTSSVARKSIR